MVSWSSERGACRRFTLAEIKKATDSFNHANFLGKGGEGKVYKGVLPDIGRTIAVKRLERSNLESFEKEVKTLSKIHHANLISLIGYCQEFNEHILVYEFMSNGNLREKLTKSTSPPLSYEQRVIICIGAARAIEYLHSGTSLDSKIIHRDVKPDNILLNEKMEAKVSDLGLSRIVPANQTHSLVTTLHPSGTPGYFAPEYYLSGKFTWRIDVYSFGVVLFEVLCKDRRLLYRDDNNDSNENFHKADDECFSQRVLRHLDPALKGTISLISLEAFINTAEKCLNKDPYQRPTMNQVVYMLDSALKLQKLGDCPISKSAANGQTRHVDSESGISSANSWEESQVSNSCQEYTSADIPGTQDKVVLYYDFTPGATLTDYMMAVMYLKHFGVDIEERDPTQNEEVETELRLFLSEKDEDFSLPQVFIGGKHIGGAKDVVRLYDSGELGQYLAVYQH